MIRLISVAAVALLASLAGGEAITSGQPSQGGFPHEKHQRVFPVCEGCHAGVATGERTRYYPQQSDCARCHDGVRVARVEWRGAAPRASNLRYSHVEHARAIESRGEEASCQTCHAAAGRPARMNVAGPNPERCLGCHAHAASTHPEQTAPCSQCHVPLAQATSLSAERVSRIARPAWHDSADYPSAHGKQATARSATCAVCHARESCERCHANADRVPQVAALSRDTRVASLVKGKSPEYPEPRSHRREEWSRAHGADATRAIASCANCHTRAGCQGCHLEQAGAPAAAIGQLPDEKGRPPLGVAPSRMASPVHAPDIAARHGRIASTRAMDCTQCHSTRTCAGCHAAADSRAFHAANFVERHAVEVFGSRNDCQSCHNTERFCRSCHASTGVASRSGMNAAFHAGKPMWVLSHGQAARMGMEACASCHRQNDCVRCHSAAAGWGVNPHGKGFPANALAARNRSSCRWCHLSIPAGGS